MKLVLKGVGWIASLVGLLISTRFAYLLLFTSKSSTAQAMAGPYASWLFLAAGLVASLTLNPLILSRAPVLGGDWRQVISGLSLASLLVACGGVAFLYLY